MKTIPFLSRRLKPKALSVWIVFFICLVCITRLLATAWQVRQAADERQASARSAVFNIASAAGQYAGDTVRQADSALKNIAERIEVEGTGPEQQRRLSQLMARNVRDIDSLQGLYLYDPSGRRIASAFTGAPDSLSDSDRASLIYHREHPGAALHLGAVIADPATGEQVVPVSRRLSLADGRFAGVVLATVPVAGFQRFFDRLQMDEQGVIFLALSQGDLLVRRPGLEKDRTANLAKGEIFSRHLPLGEQGNAVVTSMIDGVERLYAYQRVPGLPLVVAAGLSVEPVYVQWWSYVLRSFALTGVTVGALALLGFLILRQIRQLQHAESRLSAAHDELQQIARTDGLTGIANRRAFDSALESAWAQARLSQRPLGVILLDIDWFKQYNDHYGHLQGDECLKRVAGLLRDPQAHPGALAARYGGEEFVVLLPDTDRQQALAVAERVRLAIAGERLEHAGSPFGVVSISAGVVSAGSNDVPTAEALLARADSLLYAAKQQGRNRVCAQADA